MYCFWWWFDSLTETSQSSYWRNLCVPLRATSLTCRYQISLQIISKLLINKEKSKKEINISIPTVTNGTEKRIQHTLPLTYDNNQANNRRCLLKRIILTDNNRNSAWFTSMVNTKSGNLKIAMTASGQLGLVVKLEWVRSHWRHTDLSHCHWQRYVFDKNFKRKTSNGLHVRPFNLQEIGTIVHFFGFDDFWG